jgi:hypothetical protein
MFPPEVTAIILDRIKKIEAIYWDANFFD